MYIRSFMYKILVLTVVLLLKITNSYAEVIKNIEIVGNNRVSKATILNFSDLKKGDDVSLSNINESLKSLYNTKFFEDVNINIKNNLLTISVKEYPVIQEINFTGIKRKQTIEDLKEQISLKEKNPFNESLIKNDLCIGYGGLVHMNWNDKNAEISFIMDTKLEKKYFSTNWKIFLKLIEKVAFIELNFHKIFTFAIDLRPNLFPVIEDVGYIKEAFLKEHYYWNNNFIDVIIHSKFNPNKTKHP